MSIHSEALQISRVYRRQYSRFEFFELQFQTGRFIRRLNSYRIETNFNGYEAEWIRDNSYKQFVTLTEDALIEGFYGAKQFADYIEWVATSSTTPWFRNISNLYKKNIDHFGTLISDSEVTLPTLAPLLTHSYDVDKSELDSVLFARMALLEVVLRLAFLTRDDQYRKLDSWVSKSYVILFSARFGKQV